MIGDVRMENGGQVGAKSAHRERLPADRGGVVRKIKVGGAKVYVKTGEYPDGRLGEIFLQLDEYGPVVNGAKTEEEMQAALAALTEQVTDLSVALSRLLDALGVGVSIGLQYGIPLQVFCDKYEHTNFEPSDAVGPPGGRATSPLDAVFRYLRARYVPVEKGGTEEVAAVAAGDPQGGG